MKKIVFFLFISLFFFVLPQQVQALEFKTGDTVDIPQSASISGTLVVTGRNVTVRGTVDGDLICAGQNVTIEADIDGDILCAGQNVTIRSRVNGDVRTAGQNILFSAAQIARNVTAFGQDVVLEKRTGVRGEIAVGSQRFQLDGLVGKDITGGAETAQINGGVAGDVRLDVGNLTLGDTATIAGNLTYDSRNEASFAPTATVSGSVARTESPESENRWNQSQWQPRQRENTTSGFLSRIVLYGLIGFVLVKLFPNYSERISEIITKNSLKSIGIGFLSLLIMPIVIILFAITIIGIPISLILAFLWAMLFFGGRIFLSIVAGRWVLEQLKNKRSESLQWSMIVGVIVTVILFKIPMLGALLAFIAGLWGFGAVVLTLPWFRKHSGSHAKRLSH